MVEKGHTYYQSESWTEFQRVRRRTARIKLQMSSNDTSCRNVRSKLYGKDPIKKRKNGTYYFRANLGYDSVRKAEIQKYRSGFSTKKEALQSIPDWCWRQKKDWLMEKKQPLV